MIDFLKVEEIFRAAIRSKSASYEGCEKLYRELREHGLSPEETTYFLVLLAVHMKNGLVPRPS
jgi:hypothetical protein